MKKVTLKIGGMSCSACSNGLEKSLNRQNGIIGATVNLIMNNATIEYDEAIVSLDDLNKYISKAGFESLGIDDYKKEEAKNKRKKIELVILGLICLLMMYISMGHMIGLPVISFLDKSKYPINYATSLLILTIPAFIFGKDILVSGFKNAINLMPNMDTLVSLGVISSFTYSLVISILLVFETEVSFTDSLINNLYFESSAMVIFFIKVGRFIDSLSKSKTTEAIQGLMRLTPSFANVIKDGKIKKVTIDEINKGDIVICKSGETIAVDGEIINGETSIDESFITGESVPKLKTKGDKVIAGSINSDGYIEYVALKIGKDSTVSEIVRMVVEATNTKTKISRIADKVSKYFVEAVLIIALLGFIVWMIIKKDFSYSLNIFVTVLVVACPCSLGLATPIAMVVANGRCAKNGILIKNNSILEVFHKIDTILFDKTGTLTKGKFSVEEEVFFDNDKQQIINYLYSLESKSSHPLAKALIDYCVNNKGESLDVNEFKNLSGKGVFGIIDGKGILVGNEKILGSLNNLNEEVNYAITSVKQKGHTLILVVVDDNVVAIFGVSDSVRSSSIETIKFFKENNVQTVMLTGDNKECARLISDKLEINETISDVLPNEKAKVLENYHQENKVVAMVGDGINDAPSLALADVGISISNATDIAINSASVVLMQEDLTKLSLLYKISKKTNKIIKENLFWAFFYNSLMIPIALGLLSSLGININPMIASVSMMFSSLTVILNALRLNK